MTAKEASDILWNAYVEQLKQDGRGCQKTSLRTALLMGSNALWILENRLNIDYLQDIINAYFEKDKDANKVLAEYIRHYILERR
ncbi:MAG: hypothetical protein IKY26_09560 [Erysipelotrichaceae bacterium]|nr:hypothetical protein [Erysipelotrichaceae bacterium]